VEKTTQQSSNVNQRGDERGNSWLARVCPGGAGEAGGAVCAGHSGPLAAPGVSWSSHHWATQAGGAAFAKT